MARPVQSGVIALLVLTAAHAWANEMKEGDPVRNAQRMKDCIAQHEDPNISLDGMIRKKPIQK